MAQETQTLQFNLGLVSFNSDPIVENYAGKPKDLKEELGIEDDVITIDSLAKEL